jgi:23S rRNA (adenine-N6)-dimethyltransferase
MRRPRRTWPQAGGNSLAARAPGRRLARYGNVEVITADALRLPLPRRPFRVVAGLPFGSTAALLRWLLDDPRIPLRRADLVVQEEAARRYATARPADLDTRQWAGIAGFLPERR